MASSSASTSTIAGADAGVQLVIETHRLGPPRRSPSPSPSSDVTILMAHANGLIKELWHPVISSLTSRLPLTISVTIHAWDARNHGDSAALNAAYFDANVTEMYDWWDSGRDALAVARWAIRADPKTRLVGVGHSFGGCSLMMCEVLNEGIMDAMVLIEPILFTREYFEVTPGVTPHDNPLVGITRKRKSVFTDKQEARSYFGEKDFFKKWVPDALRIYVDHGIGEFKTDSGATEFRLKCPPSQEAAVFAGGNPFGVASYVPALRPPVTFLDGAISPHARKSFPMRGKVVVRNKYYASVVRRGRYVTVEGAGHMVICEKPDAVAEEIAKSVKLALVEPMSKLSKL
ncbi:hypothetical protein HK101_009011 [Irineochytrium annulatum]|nr:hypothetical protein HK101_009011 [Irineochytrium annulatum]